MNRRQFLQSISGSAVVAGISNVQAVEPTAKEFGFPRLSTSTVHYKDLTLEQACERIAGLGFEGIDIWSAYENCPHLDDARERVGPAGLKDLLVRNRLTLCSFSTYVGGFPKYAELLGKVGGGVAIQGSEGPCAAAELRDRMRKFFENLKPQAELAEQHDSWLAIENHGHALLDGLDSFQAFVDLNPYRRVGIALAPYHLQALGASVPAAIRIAGRQLLFFYAWQKADGPEQLPGHGPTDFAPWLAALKEIGYRRFVNPFMHGHLEPEAMSAALGKARDHLRRMAGSTP